MRPHQLNTDLIFTSDLVMFTRERNKSAYLSRANDARNKSFRPYICSQIAVNGKEGNIFGAIFWRARWVIWSGAVDGLLTYIAHAKQYVILSENKNVLFWNMADGKE